jgi:DNA-binding response OmpR family regulator
MDSVKVLMVDDEARMRKLVKDFLAIKGYRVIEAEDGEQAGRYAGPSAAIPRCRSSC